MNLKKINDYLYEIPKSFRPDMRVPARVYADEVLLDQIFRDKSLEQLVNTTTLPGIVKYSLAMPDAHEGYGFCLTKDAKVMTSLGFYKKIIDFEKDWEGQNLKCFDFRRGIAESVQPIRFLKRKCNPSIYQIITLSREKIRATADHPFYTQKGMIPLKKIKEKEKIAIYPFKGVPYKKPSSEIIVSEKDIEKALLKLGRKPGQAGFDQNIRVLKKRNLLPLTYDHPKLPYLLKIMGFVFGDASMNFIGKRGDGIIHFVGKTEDLEEARKDLKKIGYTSSRIYERRNELKYKNKIKTYINHHFNVNAASLVILLEALRVPRGAKVSQAYRIPKWIFKAPLWQKRLFLASLFGCELRAPHRRLERKFGFNCPTFPMGKREELVNNAKMFLKDISRLLKEFGVYTSTINQRKRHVNTKGQVSYGLELIFSSRTENLINLWGKIGYEYNKERQLKAMVAVAYLKYKQKVLGTRKRAIDRSRLLRKRKVPYRKIYKKLCGPFISERFILDVVFKGDKKVAVKISPNFLTLEEFSAQAAKDLGRSGMVWDTIKKIEKIPFKGDVYDFTVNHPDHNFVANNFVVSNCIGGVAATDYEKGGVISPGGVGFDISCSVRLLTSGLDFEEVKSHLEKLADELNHTIPSGVGRGGKIKLDRETMDKVLADGLKALVPKGYATEEDMAHCEGGGSLEGADPLKVSDRAKTRGRDQLGTLGSGNHFCSLEKIDKIFNKEVADKLGLKLGQIVVMIHTGSRGVGHQVCTDWVRVFNSKISQWGIKLPDRELACAPINTPEGKGYFGAMCGAANFAVCNHQMITHLVRKVWDKVFGKKSQGLKLLYSVAHNIGKIEEHKIDGKKMKLIVHRKGATRAFPPGHPELPKDHQETGQVVLVPGSMGTASYVLVGTEKGKESFYSVCHGAGRAMSRHAAMRRVSGEAVVKELKSKGIIIKCRSFRGIAEEAPLAYKDIDAVVNIVDKAGLAKKVARLVPLAVIKGE